MSHLAAIKALNDLLKAHEPHDWRQVGLCVWCTTCHLRLYEGDLPERKDSGRAQRQAECDHDWNLDFGQGFFGICRTCGVKEWFD